MARLTPITQLVQNHSYDLGQDHGDPTGHPAYAVGNERVGTVEGALVEDGGRLRYLIVEVGGWFPNKQVLLPVGLARIEDDRVHFGTLTRDQAGRLNAYDADREYTPEAQAADAQVLRGTPYTGPDENDPLFRTPNRLQLLEERLLVNKERVAAAQVEVGKRVETRTEQVDVPLEHEELVIERHAVTDPRPVEGQVTLGADTGSVRVELEAERADVQKQAFVTEEVEVGKRTVTETQHVTETVGREVLDTDTTDGANAGPAAAPTAPSGVSARPAPADNVKPAASVRTDTSDTAVPSAPRRTLPGAVLPAVALAGLTVFLLRSPESRAALSRLIATTGRQVSDTAASAGQVVVSGTRTAARGAEQVTASVTEAAKPIPGALATGVSAVLSAGTSAVRTLGRQEATQGNKPKAAVREVVRVIHEAPRMAEVQASIEAEVERQLDRRLNPLQQDLDGQFAQQAVALNSLSAEFARRSLEALSVEPRRQRGGVPWTLLLLGGAGYLLWRQPQVRQRVTGLFGQLSPEAQDTLQRAGQAVRQRVEGMQGQGAPRTAAQAEAPTVSSTEGDLAQERRTAVTLVENPLQSAAQTPESPPSTGGETAKSPQSLRGAQESSSAGQEPGRPSPSTPGQKKSNNRR